MDRVILLYNFSGKRLQNVRKALSPLNCVIKPVPEKDFSLPIGVLLGMDNFTNSEAQPSSGRFTSEMLVMYGFGGEMIDVLIAALRVGGVGKIELKAIVTEHNIKWSSLKLYNEIKAEHDMMQKRKV